MSERYIVVDQLKLNYEGLFNFNELYKLVDAFFFEKGYDRMEFRNDEVVTPDGKQLLIELRPWKKTTTYSKNIVKIRFYVFDLKDVEIEKEGVKIKLSQGKVMFIFDGYLESDYDNKWEAKPMFFLIRTIFDKYIFRAHFNKFEKWLVNDVYDIHGRVQKFLNLYRYEKHI